jgi:thiol-disulfide isomerase/thioredoxin
MNPSDTAYCSFMSGLDLPSECSCPDCLALMEEVREVQQELRRNRVKVGVRYKQQPDEDDFAEEDTNDAA